MQFQFTPQALHDLEKLDKPLQKKILKKLKFWSESNDPMHFTKSIQGHRGLFRFRLDDWRIIVFLNNKTSSIEILKIGHRSMVYKSLN